MGGGRILRMTYVNIAVGKRNILIRPKEPQRNTHGVETHNYASP